MDASVLDAESISAQEGGSKRREENSA